MAEVDSKGVGAPYSGAYTHLTPRLSQLIDALDRSGVRWCLLRPAATLALAVGDIDLLVETASLDRVRAVLSEQRFTPLPIRGRDLHAADYDSDSDRFLWLHVQSEFRVGADSVAAETVLETVERDPLPRPASEWLFWIVLLHDVLDKRDIPERHRPELQSLAAMDRGGAAPLRMIAARHGLDPEAVVRLAREGAWHDLLSSGSRRREHVLPPFRGLSAVRGRITRMRPWPGLSVAIIGPDGAGKTTLVNALCTSLPVPTRALYMGLTGGRLPYADALRMPGLVLVSRLILLWLRYSVGLYHRARGRIVLFDRYTLDGMVPSGAALGPLARLSRRVQAVSVPGPDLLILLDASGVAMHSRNGEYDPLELERWRAAYGRLGSLRPLEVIDAERPPDAVRRDAQARIWRCYVDRWQCR